MRNEPLTGFVLHQKPYRESRSITYFFSQAFGLVKGIGKKNLPLFVPLSVFATGKSELKNFSQSQLLENSLSQKNLSGQALFAGLYLNELLVKLLSVEEPCESLWQVYRQCLLALASLETGKYEIETLKLILRYFEQQLFIELGYGVDFTKDSLGLPLIANQYYRYQLQEGFMPVVIADSTDKAQTQGVFLGKDLDYWRVKLSDIIKTSPDFSQENIDLLNQMGKLYRQLVDNLLNYQVLQSRELWRDLAKYQ